MKNLFKPEMTLQEMNLILEHYCLNATGRTILAVKEIPLTQDDFTLMRNKLHSFVNYTGDVTAYFDVQLCIIITWIFATKYAQENLIRTFMKTYMTLPQHHHKSYMQMFASTIIEYNLETFGEDYEEVLGLCNIIYKHATA